MEQEFRASITFPAPKGLSAERLLEVAEEDLAEFGPAVSGQQVHDQQHFTLTLSVETVDAMRVAIELGRRLVLVLYDVGVSPAAVGHLEVERA